MVVDFQTKVDDKICYVEWKMNSEKKTNYDLTLSESILHWQIELDCREWGVKDLTISPTKLDGTVMFTHYTEENEYEHELDISKFEIEADDVYGESIFDSNSISIAEYTININLNKRLITVDFKIN